MRLLRLSGIVLVTAGMGACASHNAEAPPPTAAGGAATANDQASADLVDYHRHHHHGGVLHFITLSLDTLGPGDEFKRSQILKLQSDLKERLRPAREAEKNLLETLADGVASGNIDLAKVNEQIAQVGAASQAAHEASADTLNQLHAVLTPAERKALGEKVQAHWLVWRQVNHQANPGDVQHGGRLAELAQELSLTPDQVDRMSAALHTAFANQPRFDPQKAEEHVQAFIKAFEKDKFDATAIKVNASGEMASHGATRTATFVETITPLLTPEQRAKLAEHLRMRASPPAPTTGQ